MREILRGTVTDEISLAEFVASEKRRNRRIQIAKSKKCIEKADFLIENNGTIEELNKKVEKY